MTDRQQQIVQNVDRAREMILEAERWIWKHPQTGYTEWEANNYLKEKWEALGYKLVEAGDIPGFYTDIDTGRPGPTLCIMAELDALDQGNHPEAVNGMAHACGHNCQAAGLLGVAAGLKAPGALSGLSGKIRLMMVPAEELIQMPFREGLRQKGIIHYYGGKAEFIYRGYFDGVDLAMMVHTGAERDDVDLGCSYMSNGMIAKTAVYRGKSSHAGGSPPNGINAEYAAILGLNACNALRETFQDQDHIRFHPILHGVQSAVNIIPDEMSLETYVRGITIDAIKRENEKLNRALAGAAASMGARLEIHDRPGYLPDLRFPPMMKLIEKACQDLVGADKVVFDYEKVGGGSSDFGDVVSLMPGVQFRAYGATGHGHGTDYYIVDPDKACVNAAKAQLFSVEALLENGAEKAKEIIRAYEPEFKSKEEYVAFMDSILADRDAVEYNEDGTVTIRYK